MYKFTREFLEFLSDNLQVKDRKPNYGVVVHKKMGKEQFDITPVTFGPEHISIEMDRRWNMSVDELSLTISNINGEFSPDYSSKKKYTGVKELPPSGFANVLVPYNRLRINLGYNNNTVRSFTGHIQDIDIDDNNSRITVVAKNELRKLLKPIDPIDTRSLLYENKRAFEIVEDLCKRAGITKLLFEVDEIKEYDYAIDKAEFEIGMFYKDAVDSILETMGHRIFADRFGAIHIVKIELYTQNDVQHWEFDDYIDLTQGRYRMEGNIIRNRIIVQGKGDWKAYEDPFLIKYCNDEKIAMSVEAPWADTDDKKKNVANNYFMQMRRKLRRVTVATVGNPTMDVGDLVSLSLLTSTANSKYMIMGIKTSYTESGFFDVVDLEFVTEDMNVAVEAEGEYKKPDPPPSESDENESNGINQAIGITSQRQQVVSLAHKYLGIPYQWGGSVILNPGGKASTGVPNYGVDCSWFTFTVLKKVGLMSSYGRARDQKNWCRAVSKPQPGDLAFYANKRTGITTHVGIYIGNGKVISASGGGGNTNSIAVARRQNAKVKVHNANYDRSRNLSYGTPPTYAKSNPSPVKRTLTVEATAYTPDPAENGGYTTTAIGTPLRWGVIAVDPKVIPLRTKVRITYADGTLLGTFTAEDTGGAIKGNKIDILFMTKKEAFDFGRRNMIVHIL